jgi:hypothetical protein
VRRPRPDDDGNSRFPELYGQTAASIAANSPGLLPRVTKQIVDTLRARYQSKMQFILSDPNASSAIGK